MSDEEKKVATKSSHTSNSTTTFRDRDEHRGRCCADCGAEAIFDGRDEYTLCNCYSRSEYVNDGRGGYHTGGQIVDRDPDDHYRYGSGGWDNDHR